MKRYFFYTSENFTGIKGSRIISARGSYKEYFMGFEMVVRELGGKDYYKEPSDEGVLQRIFYGVFKMVPG